MGLSLLCFTACTDSSPTDSFELSGFVRERGTEDGVSGARVVFTSDTRFSRETTTDGSGFYEMVVETDQPFGQVSAGAAGFEDDDRTVFFDTSTRRIDLSLRRSP